MIIKEEVIIKEAYHTYHPLYGLILELIRQEHDVSTRENMEHIDEIVKGYFDDVAQYFFDQGRKYEQEKK